MWQNENFLINFQPRWAAAVAVISCAFDHLQFVKTPIDSPLKDLRRASLGCDWSPKLVKSRRNFHRRLTEKSGGKWSVRGVCPSPWIWQQRKRIRSSVYLINFLRIFPYEFEIIFIWEMAENYGKQIFDCCSERAFLSKQRKFSFLLRLGRRRPPQTQRAPRGPSDGSEL